MENHKPSENLADCIVFLKSDTFLVRPIRLSLHLSKANNSKHQRVLVTHTWLIHIVMWGEICTFQILFHYGLLQDIEYSPLCCIVSPYCLSIVYKIDKCKLLRDLCLDRPLKSHLFHLSISLILATLRCSIDWFVHLCAVFPIRV